jgi:PTS system ascorbate-specific IIA component
MSIGLLLITHNDIGSSLLETATKMLGFCPLQTETIAVTHEADLDLLRRQARNMALQLDRGDGVLILTDMFGATPSNIARDLQSPGGTQVLAGVNLPMLIRVLNYAGLNLKEVVEKALSGGRAGVMACPPPETKS